MHSRGTTLSSLFVQRSIEYTNLNRPNLSDYLRTESRLIIQGDSEGKFYVLGGYNIGHCEQKKII
jgi:hypothetical protein